MLVCRIALSCRALLVGTYCRWRCRRPGQARETPSSQPYLSTCLPKSHFKSAKPFAGCMLLPPLTQQPQPVRDLSNAFFGISHDDAVAVFWCLFSEPRKPSSNL